MEEPNIFVSILMFPLGLLYLWLMAQGLFYLLVFGEFLLQRLLPPLLWVIVRLVRYALRTMAERICQQQRQAESGNSRRRQEEKAEGRERRERAHREPPRPRREPDAVSRACRLLGLNEGSFTKAELGRAYRQAIRKAHPDAGGNPDRAVQINGARDLIRQHYGWS